MTNIIIVFQKSEEGKTLKSILARNGYNVLSVCTSGAQAVALLDDLSDALIISGYKLADMVYSELSEYLPEGFDMLLLAGRKAIEECYDNDIVCLSMPLNVEDFLSTVDMMTETIERRRRKKRAEPKARSAEEESIIKRAKELLMDRNHMTEPEAHRYLQKSSMDTGTGIVEAAQMVLLLDNH
ncbi:MAG: ANTAR domain-containing protein [Lachnospiraceae bacterium]|nr:ANTAR domain-containing protein [Lachnospiraceae bacterium]